MLNQPGKDDDTPSPVFGLHYGKRLAIESAAYRRLDKTVNQKVTIYEPSLIPSQSQTCQIVEISDDEDSGPGKIFSHRSLMFFMKYLLQQVIKLL